MSGLDGLGALRFLEDDVVDWGVRRTPDFFPKTVNNRRASVQMGGSTTTTVPAPSLSSSLSLERHD